MSRVTIPEIIQEKVLTRSKRRCALCYGLNNDDIEKKGQIAHIDHNSSNNSIDNLVFLCLDHHDSYDSTTSQSKNYRPQEIKKYRDKLYEYMSLDENISTNNSNTVFLLNQLIDLFSIGKVDFDLLNRYIEKYIILFNFLFTTGTEAAYCFEKNAYLLLNDHVQSWEMNSLRSNNQRIQVIQDSIYNKLLEIYELISLNDYHWISNALIFSWKEDQNHNAILEDKKNKMGSIINNIYLDVEKLKKMLLH